MQDNIDAGIKIKKHRTFKERLTAAQSCCDALKMQVPLLIDGIDDSVGNRYSGHPDRLYIIDQNGKVAYKGGRGPFGFIPGELEQSLALTLIAQNMPKEEPGTDDTVAADSPADGSSED